MKHIALVFFCFAAVSASAQMSMDPKPPVLMTGLSNLHHPVSTSNAEAQKFFDQGIRLVYAFNHDEAARAHSIALAELDQKWRWRGGAWRWPPGRTTTCLSIQSTRRSRWRRLNKAKAAQRLRSADREETASSALGRPIHAVRPSGLSADSTAITRRAMRDLIGCKYPGRSCSGYSLRRQHDESAPVEAVERGMARRRRALRTSLPPPRAVLRRDPNHIGAVHLYIHAVEASPHPERALPYADRHLAQTAQRQGIWSMPAHLYEGTGNYDGARVQNMPRLRRRPMRDYATAATGMQGIYTMMYYSHNLHFRSDCRQHAGPVCGGAESGGSARRECAARRKTDADARGVRGRCDGYRFVAGAGTACSR